MQGQQDIQLTDIRRLLLGLTPAAFLLEVALRAIVTYVLLLVATRAMGKRVAGQMSVMEMTVLITLGAAIGVPLQAPERGLLAAVVILLIAIVYQWGLNLWAFRSRRAELLLQGDVTVLVRDGQLDLAEMKRQALSHERLYSALRQSGIIHLGQIKRCYLEADGRFSIFRNADPPPGLCLMPAHDVELFESQFVIEHRYACRNCGNVLLREGEEDRASRRTPRDQAEFSPCTRCGSKFWSPAVQSTKIGDLHADGGGGGNGNGKSGAKPGPMGDHEDAKSKGD